MRDQSRKLRKNLTDAERWLWYHLRNRNLSGYKFRRQHSIGPYIVDFICIEKRMIIEVDGSHHALIIEKDKRRSDFLKEKGYRILRFWDNEVLGDGESVLTSVLSCLKESAPSPRPLPHRGGEGSD